MSKRSYKEEGCEIIDPLIQDNCILVVTATEIETEATHNKMKPLSGYNKLVQFHKGDWTYFLGIFGNYKAVHLQCEMGSAGRNSSIMAITAALDLIKPHLVLMPGIAFGIDSEGQKIGDVIIAETIYPYGDAKIGTETIIPRGTPINATKLLVNKFKAIRPSWEFLVEKDLKADLIVGAILSGEELIDNIERRDALANQYPNIKGGEMEGNGVYVACEERVRYILVKGICDFADGNKKENKIRNQVIAVEAALSACYEVFSSKTAFDPIGLYAYGSTDGPVVAVNRNSNEILFDIYDLSKEKYYINREIDGKLIKILSQSGLWVFGKSGYGKSNYILRNLIMNDIDFVFISLGSCTSEPILSYFQEILFDITVKLRQTDSVKVPLSFKECIRAIISLLENNYKNKHLILFIEEIPISEDVSEQEFAEKIFALIIEKAKIPGLENVRFVLSSINNPQSHIKAHNQKIIEQLKFLEIKPWENKDSKRLISTIISAFGLNLPDTIIAKIIKSANGSPRFIKKYFRNMFADGDFEEENLIGMCLITEIELSQF